MMELLNIEEIKTQYPNEWVLLGVEATIKMGTVLFHGKDYLELCYRGRELPKDKLTTILFTGLQNSNRKWLKVTRLIETPKNRPTF